MVHQTPVREVGVGGFQKGDFRTYRATVDVRLGEIDKIIYQDQEVEFDGSVLIYNGEEWALPKVRGAVDLGWLVPIEDTEAIYVPRPADIKVGPADNAAGKREQRMRIDTAIEDEQLVGTVDAVTKKREKAQEASQKKRIARSNRRSKTTTKSEAPEPPPTRKKFPLELDPADQEGVPVAKIMSQAVKRTRVDDGSKARQEVQRLDSKLTRAKVATTGDVDEAVTGDSLEDILPEALSTGKPAPGVFAEDGSQIDWDLGRHWRSRLSDALRLSETDRGAFNHVMAIETPKLKKHIRAAMTSRSAKQSQ